ncbi:MAG: enoyl-CoA hydratase [Alphaproteobacteria bacterium]|nr:enoyl-CoA hydratase [Alphaproteobacteria bacterium]
MSDKFVLSEKIGKVGLITLNRPDALNALCESLIHDLEHILERYESDSEIHCMILMGSDTVFAAGADIKEMQHKTYMEAYKEDLITKDWTQVSALRKPIIAAVSGYALGGGCELAMMCDFIIASNTAKFGQPEVTLGTMPGAGGTQRLTRSIGKAKAMDMCLTGRIMDAHEAEKAGLVSRIVPVEELREEALKVAQKISSYSLPILMMIKESVSRAFEMPLSEGLRFESRLFHSTFSTEDQKEGMAAFVEKRHPVFKDQ